MYTIVANGKVLKLLNQQNLKGSTKSIFLLFDFIGCFINFLFYDFVCRDAALCHQQIMRFLSMANSSRNSTPPDRNFVNALSTPPEKRTNQVCVVDLIGLISARGATRWGHLPGKMQNQWKSIAPSEWGNSHQLLEYWLGAAGKSALSKIGVTCRLFRRASAAKKSEWKSRQIKVDWLFFSGAATHPGRSTKVASASRLCLACHLQTRPLRETWGKRRPLLVSVHTNNISLLTKIYKYLSL